MENEQKSYMVPGAIVIAGLIIAGAVFYSSGGPSSNGGNVANDVPADNSGQEASPSAENIRSLRADDHILGNPNAEITIVEFSDFECPFCKNFHNTLNQVMEEYGKNGEVAWVYRHFPLTSLHSKATKEAEASECAAELGGNEGFWAYANKIFEVTPSNNGLELSQLPEIAEEIGLDKIAFEECLESGRHADRVAEDLQDAINSGGRGTPFSVIVTSSGGVFPFSGALPFEQVKSLIDQAKGL